MQLNELGFLLVKEWLKIFCTVLLCCFSCFPVLKLYFLETQDSCFGAVLALFCSLFTDFIRFQLGVVKVVLIKPRENLIILEKKTAFPFFYVFT